MEKNLAHDIDIPDSILKKWQKIVDLAARISEVRAGLIMRVQDGEIEVFAASNSPANPYQVGGKEHLAGSGLYCERVVRDSKPMFVANATKSEEWMNNPDMEFNMLCYLGFPIRFPDGKPFGSICLLNDKEKHYSQDIVDFMEQMRDLIETHLELLSLSFNDNLTGLYNRTYLKIKGAEEIARADRYHGKLTMLLLDIDHFKQVNDTFGHLTGDEILKEIARTVSSSLRGTDLAFRYGGEELVVLMPETSLQGGMDASEKIRINVEKAEHPIPGPVTVSIGVAERKPEESLADWFKRADQSLYQAKAKGRNQVAASEEGPAAPSIQVKWLNEWNSENATIDRQHRQILELGNQLIDMYLSGKGCDEMMVHLESLLSNITAHFSTEEKLLARIGYPHAARHAEIHQRLLTEAVKLKEAYMNKEILTPSAFFFFIMDDLILDHMVHEDTEFFPYVH